MSTNKPTSEEEKYFQQQELDRRKEAEYERDLARERQESAQMVKDTLGINSDELAHKLVEMGFGKGTIGIFPLIPMVYVAWADGDVSESERSRILEVASKRGADKDSEGYGFLKGILETRPPSRFFDACISTLRSILDNMPGDRSEDARQDLISLSVSVANASGGFLGLFGDKVSDEEQAILDEIIGELNSSAGASDLLNKI